MVIDYAKQRNPNRNYIEREAGIQSPTLRWIKLSTVELSERLQSFTLSPGESSSVGYCIPPYFDQIHAKDKETIAT